MCKLQSPSSVAIVWQKETNLIYYNTVFAVSTVATNMHWKLAQDMIWDDFRDTARV